MLAGASARFNRPRAMLAGASARFNMPVSNGLDPSLDSQNGILNGKCKLIIW